MKHRLLDARERRRYDAPVQWRSHQRELLGVAEAIAAGACPARDILAAVTPGGGKSALPVILAARLLPAGLARRVCWVVPRDTLRAQAEEAFGDPRFRAALGHALRLRAAADPGDDEPWRGADGWAVTYQALAADPARHLARLRAAGPVLLVLDEAHHLPADAGGDGGEEAAWSAAVAPLLRASALRLFLTGTLERGDGRPVLGLPRRAADGRLDPDAPGWAVVGYSRRRALGERAVLPVRFGALDGEARWLGPPDGEGRRAAVGPHRLARPGGRADDTTRPALFTALRTGFARALLLRALEETRAIRARRRAEGLASPGKLLVVAADREAARRALGWLREGLGPARAHLAALAVSGEGAAAGAEALARFRREAEPACLVTVAMAHEGMDAPAVAVLAALTHVRSPAWLEQMVARATRVDPGAGPWEAQRAVVFHPDDPLFAAFRARAEREQGDGATGARAAAAAALLRGGFPALGRQGGLPLPPGAAPPAPPPVLPLESNALALRWSVWRPGPPAPRGLRGASAPSAAAASPADGAEAPSRAEARLRRRLAAMVAAQALEDGAEGHARLGPSPPGGRGRSGLLHAYNAVLKRAFGGRPRAAMTAAELEAACAWLSANRLSDRLWLLEGDSRFAWTASRRFGGAVARRGGTAAP